VHAPFYKISPSQPSNHRYKPDRTPHMPTLTAINTQEGMLHARSTNFQRTIHTLAGVLTGLLVAKTGGKEIPVVTSSDVDGEAAGRTHAHMQAHTHIHTLAHTSFCASAYVRICAHLLRNTHLHTHPNTRRNTCMLIHTLRYVLIQTDVLIHACARIPTNIHVLTHIHMYKHTYTHIQNFITSHVLKVQRSCLPIPRPAQT